MIGGHTISPEASAVYWQAACRSDARLDVNTSVFPFTQAVRRGAEQSDDVGSYGRAAIRWLKAQYGESTDELRRAWVSLGALEQGRRSRLLEPSLVEHLRLANDRLATELGRREPYEEGAFTRDVAFACGFALPAGALTMFISPMASPASAPLRARRMVGHLRRQTSQYDLKTAVSWTRWTWTRPWLDLHLDPRYLAAFDEAGLRATYQAAAAVLRSRPDLAGLRAVSWLFDPELAPISPRLGFMREVALEGGALLLRLPTDADQTRYALQKSLTRQRAHGAGVYNPCCYGLYWRRSELFEWVAKSGDKQALAA